MIIIITPIVKDPAQPAAAVVPTTTTIATTVTTTTGAHGTTIIETIVEVPAAELDLTLKTIPVPVQTQAIFAKIVVPATVREGNAGVQDDGHRLGEILAIAAQVRAATTADPTTPGVIDATAVQILLQEP